METNKHLRSGRGLENQVALLAVETHQARTIQGQPNLVWVATRFEYGITPFELAQSEEAA
jgi:hypothetical protein